MFIEMMRVYQDDKVTLGFMRVDDRVYTTCEDAFHVEKIPGETRIPPGEYRIKLRKKSSKADRYREKFGDEHTGMIWLQDVPGFEHIYIHIGNDQDDSEGCVLVGNTLDPQAGYIGESTAAYSDLYPKVIGAVENGEPVAIEIREVFI
jgi:hypothetical protein